MTRVALVGDHDDAKVAHRAIPKALTTAARHLGADVSWEWLHTSAIHDDPIAQLARYDAVWCVPGSPYANTAGAIAAIHVARTTGKPFLGTCGGFQHALLEYAADVWHVAAAHAETDPLADDPVIAPLECALVEVAEEIRFVPGTRLARIYTVPATSEEYHCRYGLSPRYAARLDGGELRVAAHDARGGIVAFEHTKHPFFVCMLFQPERGGLAGRAPPPVVALLSAAMR